MKIMLWVELCNGWHYLISGKHKSKTAATITGTKWRTIVRIVMILLIGSFQNGRLIISLKRKCEFPAGNNAAYQYSNCQYENKNFHWPKNTLKSLFLGIRL